MSLLDAVAWVPLSLGALLLVLIGWEVVAERRRREEPGAAISTGRLALEGVHRYEKLAVHLSVWGGFGGGLVSAVLLEVTGVRLAIACLLGLGLTFVLFRAGTVLGGRRRFPAGLRWILAPYHGLSIWILLLATFVRRDRRGRRRGAAKKATGAAAGGQESYRRGVHDLQEMTVEEVLIPRSQVSSVDARHTLRTAIETVAGRPHKFLPVMEESADVPLGVISILDLVHPEAPDRLVREFVKHVPIVPETMRGTDLLRRFAESDLGVALVVDEFGSHAGLVTHEDLFEVLVGELVAEHEVVFKRIIPEGPGTFRVEGACRIEEFNEQVAEVLAEGEYETVAGLFLDRVGRIPQPGDDLDLPEAKLEILDCTDRRILWIRVEVPRLRKAMKEGGG